MDTISQPQIHTGARTRVIKTNISKFEEILFFIVKKGIANKLTYMFYPQWFYHSLDFCQNLKIVIYDDTVKIGSANQSRIFNA